MREAPRTKRKASRKAVNPWVRAKVAVLESDLAFVRRKCEAKWSPNGVFETLAEKHYIGRTEAIVLIAGERRVAIYVATTERWLKIERNDMVRIGE